MVERCVRDAEVVGSNPVASTTHRKSETNWFSGFLFAILVVMQQQKGKEKLTDQERFMKEAIRQAKKAEDLEEVPIGCVIVHEGKIIARGYNRRNTDKNTLSHAGALVQSRIDEVVIGCMNAKAGCAGSVMNLLQVDGFNHQVKITQGVLEEECSSMLSEFFRKLREKKKQEKAALKAAQENPEGEPE